MATKACWGIDVGQCALKAIKLRQSGGQVEAVSFDVIEHAKILSQPDADEQQLIRNALDKFLSRNDVKNDLVVVGVPGQASFSRFIKLPPVELRKVPEIVKYEARQQIPFNLDEVIWDYQTMTTPTGGPAEIEVGLFAMKRDIVQDYVSDFTQVKITPDLVQMGPVALYNYLQFDRQDGAGATLLVDVGAENTSLVIADAYRVWIRNFPLGGNNFTQALVKSFKLTFGKAENLKRHAAESKYAREVFQAMRPVFSDLLTEVQRSIGFYTSLHRESRIERVLAMGNTFRLPGIQKFLSQNLGVEVTKVARFNSLGGEQVTGAPVFKENVLSFGVAYGLALQGLGVATVTTSLLPPEILKEKELRRKRPFVAAAAAAVVLGFGLLAWGSHQSAGALAPKGSGEIGSIDAPTSSGVLSRVEQIKKKNANSQRDFEQATEALKAEQQKLDGYLELVGVAPHYGDQTAARRTNLRNLWYKVLADIWSVIPTDPRVEDYDPDTNEPRWESLQMVEVLKIWGEVKRDESADASTGAPPPGMAGAPGAGTAGGDRILVVNFEGTIPNPGLGGANFVSERLKVPLEEKGYRNIYPLQNPQYSKVAGYPYDQEDPRKKREEERKKAAERAREEGPEDATGALRTGTGRRRREREEKDVIRRPWRGDDYWFRLTWAINLDHPEKDVTTPSTTGPGAPGGVGGPPMPEGGFDRPPMPERGMEGP
jgi:type IV pilus assembly protein PilM